MKFSNAVMLDLLSSEKRAELFEPFALREILRGQWGRRFDLDEVDLSLEETEVAIAALLGDVRADLVMRGVVHCTPKGYTSPDSDGADGPKDPFEDPSFKRDGDAASPVSFPIFLGCLACEPPLDLRELLFAAKALRHGLERTVSGARDQMLYGDAKFEAMAGLIVPGSALDDDAWPGSERITGSKTRRRQMRLEHINSHLFSEGVLGIVASSFRR